MYDTQNKVYCLFKTGIDDVVWSFMPTQIGIVASDNHYSFLMVSFHIQPITLKLYQY